MKNISKDIQLALDSVIEGLEYSVDVETLDPEKIKVSMEAKTEAFKVSKKMISQWRKSRNAPSNDTLKIYLRKIIEAGDESIETLRAGLRRQIDYDELDDIKHKSAIQAKPVIATAIYEIEAGLFELRHQLETGVISTEDNEFKAGFPEKFANGEIHDISKLFKKWNNEEEEAVNICPHGTKGKVFNICDLKIQIPKPPKDKTKILFHDLKKKDQYWRRLPIPDGLSKQTADQYLDFIYEEFKRRVEGVWFYNNGVPTYLTGDMYFSLQWCRMLDNGKFMGFRIPQMEIFYFLQACIVDTRCLGDWFEKSRRTGYTFIILFIILNRITMMKNQKAGITSKSNTDAEGAFAKFSYSFLNLPFFFRPVVRGDVESKTKLDFGKPSDKTKAGKKKGDIGIEKYLNSSIDYRASVDGSYDSEQLNWYMCDESSKRVEPHDIIRHLGQVTPTMKQGGRIVGKLFGGSTVAARKKGGEGFESIADSSNVSERNSITQRTASNLYRHWIYAQENWENHIDIYGFCHKNKPLKPTLNIFGGLIEEGAIEFIQAEASEQRVKSDSLYNEYLRANPLTRSDMYRNESISSTFNMVKIHEQSVFNQGLARNPVFRGNFVWANGKRDTTVEWIPHEKGKFYVTWLPSKDMRNKFIMKGNKITPANTDIGRGGVDSYDIDDTVDPRNSKGACHFYNKGNIQGYPSNQFVLEYIHRPSHADTFYEDIIMASVFYGYPLLIENNKSGIITYFTKRGYVGYVMPRPEIYTPEGSRRTKQLGLPASTDIIDQHAQKLEMYIHFHVGIWTESDEEEATNNGGTGYRDVGDNGVVYFDRTLKDWSSFDKKKRTPNDASVSSGLALMAADVEIRPPREKYIVKNADKLVRTYKKSQRKWK